MVLAGVRVSPSLGSILKSCLLALAFKIIPLRVMRALIRSYIFLYFSRVASHIFEGPEVNVARLFLKLIKTGDVIVDVGASLGFYTLLAAKLIGEHGMVIALEPHPWSYSMLRNNVRLNELRNVIIFQLAAGESTYEAGLSNDPLDGPG